MIQLHIKNVFNSLIISFDFRHFIFLLPLCSIYDMLVIRIEINKNGPNDVQWSRMYSN